MNLLASSLPPWGIALIVVAAVVAVAIIALVISLIVRAKKEGRQEIKLKVELSQPALQSEQGQPVSAEEDVLSSPVQTTESKPVREEPVREEPAYEESVVQKKKTAATTAVKNHKSAPEAGGDVAAQSADRPAAEEQQPAVVKDSPAEEKAEVKAEKAKPATKTYHISKRKAENKWQVKIAGGSKAIKMFNTQAEAIDFAKKLAENQEAKIVIHKEDGSFRRLTYHKKK